MLRLCSDFAISKIRKEGKRHDRVERRCKRANDASERLSVAHEQAPLVSHASAPSHGSSKLAKSLRATKRKRKITVFIQLAEQPQKIDETKN